MSEAGLARRQFLIGTAASLIFAPAVVRPNILMPITRMLVMTRPNVPAEKRRFTPAEQRIINIVARDLDRPLTEQEINLALAQAELIGEL